MNTSEESNLIQDPGCLAYNRIGLHGFRDYNNPCNHSTMSEDKVPEMIPPIIP